MSEAHKHDENSFSCRTGQHISEGVVWLGDVGSAAGNYQGERFTVGAHVEAGGRCGLPEAPLSSPSATLGQPRFFTTKDKPLERLLMAPGVGDPECFLKCSSLNHQCIGRQMLSGLPSSFHKQPSALLGSLHFGNSIASRKFLPPVSMYFRRRGQSSANKQLGDLSGCTGYMVRHRESGQCRWGSLPV